MRLVPADGVQSGHGGDAYADPKLRDARLVDYSRPGFAVVYLKGVDPAPARVRALRVTASRLGAELQPRSLAMSAGETLRISNGTRATQFVSIPALGTARNLAAGAEFSIHVDQPGEIEVFLLGPTRRRALVFAADGRWVRTSADGRWQLPDLPPGRFTLVAWRPRFPEAQRTVDVSPGAVDRLDLEITIVQSPGEPDAVR